MLSTLTMLSIASAIAVSVLLVKGEIPLYGQTAAPFRGRSIERVNGRRAVAGEVLVRFRGTPTTLSLNSL